jgi:prepilin-type N-terminal cleavage/methylation domain-containing protein
MKRKKNAFTLIELLAVIVIMAIILVVTVPNIINSINDARVASIHNLAVSVANTYDTAFAQDLVATSTNKLLGKIPEKMTTTWKCIGSTDFAANPTNGTPKSLTEVLKLSSNDLVLTGTVPSETALNNITADYCSAIRIYNGSAQVILVAKTGGKFYVAQYHTYALSTASTGGQNAITS